MTRTKRPFFWAAGAIALFLAAKGDVRADLFTDVVDQASKEDPLKSLALMAADKVFTYQGDVAQYPLEPIQDDGLQTYCQKVLASLEAHSKTQGFKFLVLKTARVQGLSDYYEPKIEITRGMLNMIDNGAELACLMGHEIGHRDLGHFDQLYSESKSGKVESAGIEAVGDLLGQKDVAATADRIKGNVEVANFNQEKEQKADEYGALLAEQAGFDAFAFADLFDRLAKRTGTDHLGEVTAGHRSLDSRAAHIREFLKGKGFVPGKGSLDQAPFQKAVVKIASIRTGEGPPVAADRDTTGGVSKELDGYQAVVKAYSGKGRDPKKFMRAMSRLSDICRQYGFSRTDLYGEKALDRFMEDGSYQDHPFRNDPSRDPGGKVDPSKDSILKKIRRLLGIKSSEDLQQEVDQQVQSGQVHSQDYYEKNIDQALTKLVASGMEQGAVGNGVGLYEGISGRDFITGQPLTPADRTMSEVAAVSGWTPSETLNNATDNAVKGHGVGSYFNTLSDLYTSAAGDIATATDPGLQASQNAGKILDSGTDWQRTDDPSAAPARDGVFQFQTKADQAYYKVELGGREVYFDHSPTADDGIGNAADGAERVIVPAGTTLRIQKVQGVAVFLR